VSITVETILQRIKELRTSKGLTHGHMTANVQVKNAASYSKIEKSRLISVQRLIEIAEALDVDITYFFENPKIENNLEEAKASYGDTTKHDIADLYRLVNEIRREIMLLKKEIKHPTSQKKKKKQA
jgi:transcriptional regulator with XRE-family HTH domain